MGNTYYKKRQSAEEYANGILAGDRVQLSKAITLIESTLSSDNDLAEEVLRRVLPFTGRSLRLGITGVPGVGKSSFIETFGKYLTSLEKKTAVLTIDPTSPRSRGSILGDKTRMEQLANDPYAYIRPSAAGETLGGVHSKTREAMLLCEAAGYEVIIVETVGVGQSEVSVKGMVDFFLLLMLAGAGDELQGIKKGIMEMADAIAITKADGDNTTKSEMAKREYQNALHLFPIAENGWQPQVVTCSALLQQGIAELWQLAESFRIKTVANGSFENNRRQQQLAWMKDVIAAQLQQEFYQQPAIQSALTRTREQVASGELPAITAAKSLLSLFRKEVN